MKKTLSVLLVFIMVLSTSGAFFTNPVVAEAETYKSGGFNVTVSSMSQPKLLKKGASFTLKGKLQANRKITKITFVVEDLDRFVRNINTTKTVNSKTVNLGKYASSLKFNNLYSGEKRLNIKIYDANKNCVVLKQRFTVLGKAKEPVHITNNCKITVNKGNVKNILDSSEETCWQSGRITVYFPKDKTTDGILIKWYMSVCPYTLKTYDKSGKVLNSCSDKSMNMLNQYFAVNKNAVKAVIDVKNQTDFKGIATLRVYEKGRVGYSVQKWKTAQNGKCDLMVISAHCDDELLYFGGTIPYYQNVVKKNVYVVYVSSDKQVRNSEAMNGLWSIGCRNYPIFLGYEDKKFKNGIEETLERWGGEDAVLENMVGIIRRYKPKVIVSHDVNGEYGHPAHKTIAYLLPIAIEMAKDSEQYPASCDEYGTWEVQKLYLHMFEENKVVMKCYSTAYAAIDGRTPYQLACIAFDKHLSQYSWSMTRKEVVAYPNNQYGLVYSAVGEDKLKNDFFENVN